MCRNDNITPPVFHRLLMAYGELLTLEDVAKVYRYNSIGAVRKAYSRGVLPFELYKLPGKVGLYAKAEDVANSLENLAVAKHA